MKSLVYVLLQHIFHMFARLERGNDQLPLGDVSGSLPKELKEAELSLQSQSAILDAFTNVSAFLLLGREGFGYSVSPSEDFTEKLIGEYNHASRTVTFLSAATKPLASSLCVSLTVKGVPVDKVQKEFILSDLLKKLYIRYGGFLSKMVLVLHSEGSDTNTNIDASNRALYNVSIEAGNTGFAGANMVEQKMGYLPEASMDDIARTIIQTNSPIAFLPSLGDNPSKKKIITSITGSTGSSALSSLRNPVGHYYSVDHVFSSASKKSEGVIDLGFSYEGVLDSDWEGQRNWSYLVLVIDKAVSNLFEPFVGDGDLLLYKGEDGRAYAAKSTDQLIGDISRRGTGATYMRSISCKFATYKGERRVCLGVSSPNTVINDADFTYTVTATDLLFGFADDKEEIKRAIKDQFTFSRTSEEPDAFTDWLSPFQNSSSDMDKKNPATPSASNDRKDERKKEDQNKEKENDSKDDSKKEAESLFDKIAAFLSAIVSRLLTWNQKALDAIETPKEDDARQLFDRPGHAANLTIIRLPDDQVKAPNFFYRLAGKRSVRQFFSSVFIKDSFIPRGLLFFKSRNAATDANLTDVTDVAIPSFAISSSALTLKKNLSPRELGADSSNLVFVRGTVPDGSYTREIGYLAPLRSESTTLEFISRSHSSVVGSHVVHLVDNRTFFTIFCDIDIPFEVKVKIIGYLGQKKMSLAYKLSFEEKTRLRAGDYSFGSSTHFLDQLGCFEGGYIMSKSSQEGELSVFSVMKLAVEGNLYIPGYSNYARTLIPAEGMLNTAVSVGLLSAMIENRSQLVGDGAEGCYQISLPEDNSPSGKLCASCYLDSRLAGVGIHVSVE